MENLLCRGGRKSRMDFKEKCKRYWRILRRGVHWIFMERLRGLDFSMRDKSTLIATGGIMHSYRTTPPGHFQAVLEELDFGRKRSFLDIGCGKGLVLKLAREHSGFTKCTGLEYNRKTADICTRNMRRLRLDDVTVWVGDAREFEDYESYDTFYLFNPFGPEVFRDVIKKIPSNGTTIIYHNPTCDQLVIDTGRFQLKKQLYDKFRNYYTNIYIGIDE